MSKVEQSKSHKNNMVLIALKNIFYSANKSKKTTIKIEFLMRKSIDLSQ